MLARHTTRRADIAVRMAMGAGRWRVTRQIITESVLLGCLGGLAGLAVAYAGSQTILALAFPDSRDIPIHPTPSMQVLAFSFLISVVTGVFFGMAPAWMSSHSQPAEVLRGASRTTRDRSSLPQKVLVVLQAALSVVLIAGAILLTRSLNNLEHQNFGIQTANRYVFHLDPAGAGYTVDRLPALYRQIEDRFANLPGVANVALAMYSPLEGDNWSDGVFVQGHAPPRPNDESWATWDRVSPDFLESIGVAILRGRGLTADDTASSRLVAVVNESFVKKFFPEEDPIGKHFGTGGMENAGAFEIVGVMADFKMNDVRRPPRRIFLRPQPQQLHGIQARGGRDRGTALDVHRFGDPAL